MRTAGKYTVEHDWHTFDERLGYEVRRQDNIVEIWTPDERRVVLNLEQFNKLRGTGPKPGGLS